MRHIKLAVTALLLTLITGCQQVTGLKNLKDCRFAFHSVSNVKVAGIDITNKKSLKKLNIADAAMLMAAYTNKDVPATLDVNMVVKNPNADDASLDGMDYIVWIDEQQMLDGTLNEKVTIPGNGEAKATLPVAFNLYEKIEDRSATTMANFALGLATNNAEASRIKVSIKPFFTIGGKTIKFPSYITIGGDQIMPQGKKQPDTSN